MCWNPGRAPRFGPAPQRSEKTDGGKFMQHRERRRKQSREYAAVVWRYPGAHFRQKRKRAGKLIFQS